MTEAYARAVFAGHCPPSSEEIVDQHTEGRLSRQKLLTRIPLTNRATGRSAMCED
ncbi:Scr1 family TA system antitoxin-like transcriptional regulator [Streptomyces sp. NPDC057565]|uniref:Scr1 family TA system antitoxin-like transcriptional regulator n=1 Tax=Streptomyces sp. NPDC057565 TaxID=3346169 RepID=UPI0036BDC4EF